MAGSQATQRAKSAAPTGSADHLVAAFLASQDSSFMTASEIAVDGGLAQV
jgi:hypothetical protein